jgi:putative ABC transport system permease protein
MNPFEAARSSLANLAVHKLRSALTMLGMIFGVGAVIAMLAIGAGAERQALDMIQRMGLSNILVRTKTFRSEELAEIRKKSPGLSERDRTALAEGVPGVSAVGPKILINPYRVASGTRRTEATVFGVSAQYASLVSLPVSEGRFLDATDEKTFAQVCVIGPGVKRELFGFESAIGKPVKVNDVWLAVIGVLQPATEGASISGSGSDAAAGSSALEIYLPYTTALRKFDRDPLESPLQEIVIQLEAGTSPQKVVASVSRLLDRLHGGTKDFELIVPEALLEQRRKTQRLFSIVMGCIAGISLLVGGIGIMNIMLASVLERTREIGIRRAIGARRRDIHFQFIVEAFALSFSGAILGILFGVLIAGIVATSAGWPTVVTFWSLAVSTGVSAAVGLLAGSYPASRAAALDPIEALRYE